VFRVRVQATQKDLALITKAARMQGLSAPQFVTRVVRKLGRNLKARKIAPRRPTSSRQTKPPRRKLKL
jgi:hypothetical protein